MKSLDDWNLIVSDYLTSQYALESTIQEKWELYCSEIFNYKSIRNEINSQRHVPFGRNERGVPDIILRLNNRDIVDIELKQYRMAFSDEMEQQLISYMNQLHISIGVLICNKIYVYSYHYANNQIKKLEIPFEKDNPDGIKFVELFTKENFSEKSIEEFIDSKKLFFTNVEKIKSEITKEKIFDLLEKHFQTKFSENEINAAFADTDINISSKERKAPDPGIAPPIPPIPTISGDKCFWFEGTKYKFQCRLILAVVKAYVRDNPKVTYHQLEAAFPKDLQGSYGVFLPIEEACNRVDLPSKRFFTDEPILLTDGKTIVVCSQWGNSGTVCNTGNFINHAKRLGYEITVSQ